MTGSFGEMGNLLKQAQEMQRQLDRVKAELAEEHVEGSAGGGAVRVDATCDRRIHKVEIADEVIKGGDKALIEELVVTAIRDAMSQAEARAQKTASDLTGGMQLPGLF